MCIRDRNSTPVDIPSLRAEVRLQRFGGASLPHVGTSLASDARRSLFVIFGEFAGGLAVLRILRPPNGQPLSLIHI